MENLRLGCAVCKLICCNIVRCSCCKKPNPAPMEFNVICIGLSGSGKTTLLSILSKQSTENIQPTTGFMIKACKIKNCILNVKEIGGAESMRQYWRHYYAGMSAVVFVLDSSCDSSSLQIASGCLTEALTHPDLQHRPCLILANFQDMPNARSVFELKEILNYEELSKDREILFYSCNADNVTNINAAFEQLVDVLMLGGS